MFSFYSKPLLLGLVSLIPSQHNKCRDKRMIIVFSVALLKLITFKTSNRPHLIEPLSFELKSNLWDGLFQEIRQLACLRVCLRVILLVVGSLILRCYVLFVYDNNAGSKNMVVVFITSFTRIRTLLYTNNLYPFEF